MKVKIIATGESGGTQIVNEHGDDLAHVATGISIDHEAGELPVITIRASLIPFEVAGQARLVDASGREISRIEYADGEAIAFEPTKKADRADAVDVVNLGTNAVLKVT